MSAKRTLGLGLMSLLVWASAVWAEPLVDLNLADLTLGEAAAMLSKMDGVTVAVDPAVAPKTVGVVVEQMPLSVALQLIAEAGGLTLTSPQPGAYLLAPAGPASATKAVWTPLRRGEVVKELLTTSRISPSKMAGYFGRPGLMAVDGRTVLQHPALTTPKLLSAWVPDEPQSAAKAATVRSTLGGNLEAQQAARWSDKREETGCGPFLRLPKGVRAVIGFDPMHELIVVGTADGVKQFAGLVAELDNEPASVTVGLRLLRLSAAEIDKLGLNWTATSTGSGNAEARTATVPAEQLAALLAKAPAAKQATGPTMTLTATQPVVLSLAAVSVMGTPGEACPGLPEAMVPDIESVMACADMRLMAWRRNDNTLAMLIDPVIGISAAGLKQAGQKAELTQPVPCVAMLHNVPAGQALVMREFTANQAPERVCPMLGELPLVGSLFNPASSTDRGWEAVLVLVPEG